MREILFRGKDVDKKEWVYGGYSPYPHVRFPCTPTIYKTSKGTWHPKEVIPDTVGQYTGLTDKNGKKIFEGDIVRYAIYPPDQFVYGVVNYKDGVFRIGDQGCALCVCADDGIDEYRLEVIGNIHDNPELMGGTENVSHP